MAHATGLKIVMGPNQKFSYSASFRGFLWAAELPQKIPPPPPPTAPIAYADTAANGADAADSADAADGPDGADAADDEAIRFC